MRSHRAVLLKSGRHDSIGGLPARRFRFGRCPTRSGVAWEEPRPERPSAAPPWLDAEASAGQPEQKNPEVNNGWHATVRQVVGLDGGWERCAGAIALDRVLRHHPGRDGVAVVAFAAGEQERMQRLIAQFKRPTSFYLLESYAGAAEVHLDQWEAGDRSLPTRRAARKACSALRTFARVFPIASPELTPGPRSPSSPLGPARPGTAGLAGQPVCRPTARYALRGRPCAFRLGRGAGSQQQRQWHQGRAQTLLHELGVIHAPPSLH